MSAGAAGESAVRSLWRFHGYGRPHLRILGDGIGLRLAEMLADLAQPRPLVMIVDNVIGHRPVRGVMAAVLAPVRTSPICCSASPRWRPCRSAPPAGSSTIWATG